MAAKPACSAPRAAFLAGCLLCIGLGSSVGFGLAGCKQEASPELPPPEQTYSTRGRIESLSKPGEAPSVIIFHEKIPDFVGRDGKVVGMNPMPMPFTPAEMVSMGGFQPGDKVEFTFEVRWTVRPFSRLIKISKLPPETELNFSR